MHNNTQAYSPFLLFHPDSYARLNVVRSLRGRMGFVLNVLLKYFLNVILFHRV